MAYRSKVTKKKCVGVRKKPPQKKPVGNALAATSEETNLEPAKATYKADTMAKDEDNSDKPARNTRAATKNQSKQGSTESLDDTSTAPTTVTTSKRYPNEPADKTSAATKESSSEPVNISSEDDVPLASLKRKGATEDKWTETTDLPRLKSSKLDKGK